MLQFIKGLLYNNYNKHLGTATRYGGVCYGNGFSEKVSGRINGRKD